MSISDLPLNTFKGQTSHVEIIRWNIQSTNEMFQKENKKYIVMAQLLVSLNVTHDFTK